MAVSPIDGGIIDCLTVFVDLVRVVIWPATLLFLGWLFRGDLKPLFEKVSHVGPAGVNFFQQGKNAENASVEPEAQGFSKLALGELNDQVAKEIEDELFRDIQKLRKDEVQPVLVRALTSRTVEKIFSLAYADIFGSQIRALEDLNERTISAAEAQHMFENLKKVDHYFDGVSLEQYLNFLFVFKFIENQGNSYAITRTGRNFLGFLTSHGLSKNRLH